MEESSVAPEEGSILPRQSRNGSNGAEKADKKGVVHWFKKNLLGKSGDNSLKTELEEIIQEHEEAGDTAPEDNMILRNVLKFSDVRVTEVMTPSSDIDAVPIDISLENLKTLVAEMEHTRLPVYRNNLDDVIGFLHIKDLIKFWVQGGNFSLEAILRELIYVPPSMKIIDLLEKMKLERTHMALVVDEYGGTDGLLTIEDLVEEIVGEIEDEYDEEEVSGIKKLSANIFEVMARVEIAELEEEFGMDIYSEDSKEDFHTIGGLIFTFLGKVPEIGEELEHPSGLKFKVLQADNRRIEKVEVTRQTTE